jgi:uncharacterized membrane protein YgdD (TMEM256/DUF423 family)
VSDLGRPAALVIGFAAVNGALAVAVGAAAAHVTSDVPNARELLRTGSDYQLWHALALLAAALLLGRTHGWSRRLAGAAAAAFALGVLLFSLSLYWAALGGRAAAAPFGGSLLILGWLLLAACGAAAAAGSRPARP